MLCRFILKSIVNRLYISILNAERCESTLDLVPHAFADSVTELDRWMLEMAITAINAFFASFPARIEYARLTLSFHMIQIGRRGRAPIYDILRDQVLVENGMTKRQIWIMRANALRDGKPVDSVNGCTAYIWIACPRVLHVN